MSELCTKQSYNVNDFFEQTRQTNFSYNSAEGKEASMESESYKFVAELRRRTGLSIRQFAQFAGLPNSTYSYYESEKFSAGEIKPAARKKIAAALIKKGIPMDDVAKLGSLSAVPKIEAEQIEGGEEFTDRSLRQILEGQKLLIEISREILSELKKR